MTPSIKFDIEQSISFKLQSKIQAFHSCHISLTLTLHAILKQQGLTAELKGYY